MSFKKYNLTESQLKQIARLCQQEQGTVTGAKAEASLMANQLETSKSRQNKYGTGADGLYNWVRNGKWFARAAYYMDNGELASSVLEGVRDVLVNGNRTLPKMIDEHDCLNDIKSISTGSVKDKSAYIKGKTIVKNNYGSTWTFWCFPDSSSDPFGYTDAALKAVNDEGGDVSPETPSPIDNITLNETVKYIAVVDVDSLNVRTNCGTEYSKCSFSPLTKGTEISVCHDNIKGTDGDMWAYILYEGKHGFVCQRYYDRIIPVDDGGEEMPSGDPIERVLNIAFNEVGYLEKASNKNLDSKTGNAGDDNYTKYARDCFPDLQGCAWCAMFSEWCLVQAFGRSTANKMVNGLSADCDEVAQNFKDMGRFYKTPKKGDLILFVKNGNDYYHVGIVYDVTGSTVYTVEGNTSAGSQVIPNGGAVCKKSYALGNGKIGGYGRPNYSLAGNVTPTPTPAPTPSKNLNESVKWTGVTNQETKVRTWAGASYDLCSFSPLPKGTPVGVCDSLESENGYKWYYISYNGKHGFVLASRIDKKEFGKKKASDITVQQFLTSCKNVMNTARANGYHYGDSHSTPPCKDKTISCDRLIARALYDLGFTDQRQGGETCGTLDNWLKAHGFKRSTKAADIKKGSILLVKHEGKSYISHAFVVRAYNASNWVTDRYDAGSDDRIRTQQPLKNVTWGYQKKNFVVYNIPS